MVLLRSQMIRIRNDAPVLTSQRLEMPNDYEKLFRLPGIFTTVNLEVSSNHFQKLFHLHGEFPVAIFQTIVRFTVCSYHVKYAFQSESTLYSCLAIWILSDCNWTQTQNHLVHKQTLNRLFKPFGSVFVYDLSDCGFESSCSHIKILMHMRKYSF